MKKGKVLDYNMAATRQGITVRVNRALYDEIDNIVFVATGLKVKTTDFVEQAINEKLEVYREMAKKKAAESKKRHKELDKSA